MKKILLAAAAIFAVVVAIEAQQAAPANTEITTIHVQGNVYMLQGAGGNVAVQIGDMGVVVVDTGLAQNADKLIAAIRKLERAGESITVAGVAALAGVDRSYIYDQADLLEDIRRLVL